MTSSDPAIRRTARASLWRRVAAGLCIVQVRLRFLAVLAVAFAVIGQWDGLRNYWDKFMRRLGPRQELDAQVSLDTEYFCPMDPGVLSDWPGKCGVCNMPLVRRRP